MEKKVLVVAPVHQVLLDVLQGLGYTIDCQEQLNTQEALEIVDAYEGVVTSTRLQIDRRFLDRASRLKWIGRMGSGMEQIDVVYADKLGISCFSSPEGNANAVAEQALGMLLALTHRITYAHTEMQQMIWKREENRGEEIEGMTAGIIGYGHNGSAFARKLKGIGLRVMAYDKYKSGFGEEGIEEFGVLESVWQQADIVSFHLPYTEETKHYFNRHFLNAMQKPFILLNLSRGSVVEMNSLYEGLKNGKIKAAGIDVWETEPITKMTGVQEQQYRELIGMPNFIGTPHIGGYTHQALYKMSFFLAEKIKKWVTE